MPAFRRLALVAVFVLACSARRAAAQYPCEQWTQLAPIGSPPKRFGHQLVYDSDRQKLIMWGGETRDPVLGLPQYLDDTWELDVGTDTWTAIDAVDAPGGRTGYAMAYDSDAKLVELYGGIGADTFGTPYLAISTYAYNPATHTWRFDHGTPSNSGIVQAAMAYDPVRHQMIVFGGRDDDRAYDTTIVDGSLVAPAHRPAARIGHTMVWSPTLGGVVLYGGESFGDSGFGTNFADVWLWDGTDWSALPGGPARTDHGAVWDTTYDKMIVFGGTAAGTTTSDVLFRISNDDFAVHLTTDGPFARGRMGFAWDDAHHVAVLFGGKGGDDISAGTWTFAGRPPDFAEPPLARETPPCHDNFFTFAANGIGPFTIQWQRLLGNVPFDLHDNARMFGTTAQQLEIDPVRPSDSGFYRVAVTNACGTTPSAPFSVTVQEGAWVGDAVGPPREVAQMAYDSGRGTVVLFGGFQAPGEDGFGFATENDTWEYDGSTWTRVQKTSVLPGAIPGRNGAAMAYDPVRAVTVMYGGHYADNTHQNDHYLSDTWEWDGSTWTQKAPGPGQRYLGKMVWDSERQRIELYGGRLNGSTQANDLWEWDGTTWAPRATTGGPPFANEGAAIAYDDVRKALVVQTVTFGAGVTPEGQTWDLVDSHWTLRGTTTESALMYVTLVFDGARGHPIAVGFHNVANEPQEMQTWEMSAPGTFRRMNVGDLLPNRSNYPMVYDSQRQREVIEGGKNLTNGNELLETRELTFEGDPLCGVTVCGDGVVDPSEDCDPFSTDDGQCCHQCVFRPEATECGTSHRCDAAGHCLFTTCGNFVLDPGEECDIHDGFDAFFDACCNLDCTLPAAGTSCYGFPEEGTCDGLDQCVSQTCGNGVVDTVLEECDGGDCCSPDCRFTPVGACGNACAGGQCVDDGAAGVACDATPHDGAGCSAGTSTSGFLDTSGGTIMTPDGSAALTVPAGVGPTGRYSIGSHLAASGFGIGSATMLVLAARFEPSTTFASPGATITLHWADADDDGVVDGAGVDERTMQLFHDGVSLGACGSAAGCNRATNAWTFQTLSFSEFTLAGAPPPVCASFTAPKLALGKLRPPAGDDTLSFAAAMTAPASAPDPDTAGLGFLLADGVRTVVDVDIPAGAYDKKSKIGWKVDKKRTAWTWSHPKDGAPAGLVKVKLTVKKGTLRLAVKGVKGDFAAAAPVHLTLTLPANAACGSTRFDGADQACVVKSKGKILRCK